jgi:hypothetical protein
LTGISVAVLMSTCLFRIECGGNQAGGVIMRPPHEPRQGTPRMGIEQGSGQEAAG